MRLGALIAQTNEGEYQTLNAGHDIESMKKELKSLKEKEGDGKFQAAYLMINPIKKYRFKPMAAQEKAPRKKRGE